MIFVLHSSATNTTYYEATLASSSLRQRGHIGLFRTFGEAWDHEHRFRHLELREDLRHQGEEKRRVLESFHDPSHPFNNAIPSESAGVDAGAPSPSATDIFVPTAMLHDRRERESLSGTTMTSSSTSSFATRGTGYA